MRNPRTLAQMKADPRVESFSDERYSHSGLWFYLKAGWIVGQTDTHQVAEDTVKECAWSFETVRPCACADCLSEMAANQP